MSSRSHYDIHIGDVIKYPEMDMARTVDHVYMIGGATRLGGLPSLLGRVTLSARGQHCHVNVSRSVNPPTRGAVHVTKGSNKENNSETRVC